MKIAGLNIIRILLVAGTMVVMYIAGAQTKRRYAYPFCITGAIFLTALMYVSEIIGGDCP